MERWAGRVAVVSGASAGIGAAIVRKLLEHGMVVVGLARRLSVMEEMGDSLKDLAGKFHPLECDVGKEESVATAFSWIRENVGSVDVLVNNAGVAKESSLADGSSEDWRSVFETNVLGICLCTREAVRAMRESASNDDAVIIHLNSFAGERIPPVGGFGIYPATKRAVTALAQTLRHELAGTSIRVMSISPGLVRTEFMASFSTFSPEAMAAIPALQPEDIADALIYMLSTPSRVVVQDVVLRPLGECW